MTLETEILTAQAIQHNLMPSTALNKKREVRRECLRDMQRYFDDWIENNLIFVSDISKADWLLFPFNIKLFPLSIFQWETFIQYSHNDLSVCDTFMQIVS